MSGAVEQKGKGLGIAAFVLLLISLPIPFLGNYLSLLAVLILAGAAWQGEKTWVVVTDLIAWVKMLFLSPTWHLMMFGGGYMRGMAREMENYGPVDAASRRGMQDTANSLNGTNAFFLLLTLAILAAPLIIMFWRKRTAAKEGGTDA